MKKIAITVGVVFFLFLGSILPRMNMGVFASPDETAIFLFAHSWTPGQGFRLPIQGDVFVKTLPGLHPRSMVQQGDWLVPAGFLGMPFLVMVLNHLTEHAGEYMTLLLTVSSVIPLFFLIKKSLGSFVAWSAIVIYGCFPTVLLYVNRGLFPNLPVIGFVLWGMWLARLSVDAIEKKSWREWAILGGFSGLSYGLALCIRPIEALWILPWMVWSFWPIIRLPALKKQKGFYFLIFGVCLLAMGVTGLWLSMKTYPFHSSLAQQPISGYQLKDVVSSHVASVSTEGSTREIRSLLPFGVHPRILWSNIRLFFFNHQGIWFGAAILGALSVWLSRRRASLLILLLSAWTCIALFGMYGQVAYADNINGVATLGNSFLRYMLPIAPLLAIGSACSADALRKISNRGMVLGVSLVVFLCGYGIAYAMSGDAESILATRRELMRYRQIHSMAAVSVPTNAVIISERSDKIFASGGWVVASPIPEKQTLIELRNAEEPVYLFHRLIERNADAPKDVIEVFSLIGDPLVVLDNEGLYPLYDFSE